MLEIDPKRVKRYWTRWWGQRIFCDPRFVKQALGDGNVLLGLEPLNTRPHYYIIRVDSRWHLSGCSSRACDEDECPDELVEHLEEIYEAIEEEYGEVNRIRESNEEYPEEKPDSDEWPVMDLDIGASWFTFWSPEKYLTDAVYCLQAETIKH